MQCPGKTNLYQQPYLDKVLAVTDHPCHKFLDSFHPTLNLVALINFHTRILDFGSDSDLLQISHSRCVPRLRMFIFEELLPYWLNCAECGKFRRISRCAHSSDSTLSASIVAAFRCSYAFPEDFEGDPCSVPEDPVSLKSPSKV